jgi:hypothetical protein
MSDNQTQQIADDLVGSALSLGAFNISTDLNTKLSLLQKINKEYSSLYKKLESGKISSEGLDAATPIAKEKLSSEIERRSDFGFDADESDKLAKTSPSKVDQIVGSLKQRKTAEITVSIVFREQEDKQ